MSTIVVLDDLRTSRSILTQLAFTVEKDVRVEAFARPDEALEWVRDHTPDLVVTDYEMPGMDGSEFISRFRALHSCSDVPVIVVTVHEDPEFRHKALQVGATDFLLSPVDHEEFRARSQNLLSLRAHHRLTQLRADDLAKAVATSDRRLQDALRENHAQLESLIDAVPSLISVTDQDARFVFMNRHHEEILGIRPQDAVGRSLSDVMGEDYAPRHMEADRIVRETGMRATEFEETIVDRQGCARTFLTTKSPMGPTNGSIVHVVTSSSDITTRREAEREIEVARDTAEAADKTKTEFLAHISHELRTPLNAVVGFSEIMNDELFGALGNEKYREYVSAIRESGVHLLDIINEMLDLSVAEIGKLELHEEVVDPQEVLSACARIMKDQADENEVTLKVEIAPDSPRLLADGRKIRQVMINLLSNAIKFTDPGGKVEMKAWLAPDGGYIVDVVDTGIGIPSAHLKKVLTPFGQVESALSRKYKGTGLGLPLSKRLVELHAGTLSLASVEGEGTSVRVILPKERTIPSDGSGLRAESA